MFISLSDHIRLIGKIAAEKPKFKLWEVKIYFKAPHPDKSTTDKDKSLTLEKEPANNKNFQWIAYQIFFTTIDNIKYIYNTELTSTGENVGNPKVFESDDDWSGDNIDVVQKEVTPGEVVRTFPKFLKGPNLFPANIVPFGVPANYVNTDSTDRDHHYSSKEFKKFFDDKFYIVMNEKSKILKNPFGEEVEPAGKTYPEKEETPEEGK